jgi:hypothetical protein
MLQPEQGFRHVAHGGLRMQFESRFVDQVNVPTIYGI